MGFKKDLLATGEVVIFHARAHWKNLVPPALVLVLMAVVVWLLDTKVVTEPDLAWLRWTIAGLGAIVVVIWTAWPVLKWLTSTDTLTNHRLISRHGVITRRGRDLPMDRVHAVSYERNLLDRILGCGTLVVQTAGDDANVLLYDVAHLERRLLQMQELLLDEDIPGVGPDGMEEEPKKPRRPDAGHV